MLSIRVGPILYSLPGEQVTHIDYLSLVTPLPFVRAPIEGLVSFNAQPLLQINVADALGVEPEAKTGNKRLIVNTAQGNFSLRIDEVVKLSKTKTSGPDEHQQPPPRLRLEDILRPLLKAKKSSAALKPNNSPVQVTQQNLTVLLVATGDKTLALLAHNIERIQEMTALQTLDEQSGQDDLLIKVKDHLLPTHSLAHLLQLNEAGAEPLAVIVRGAQTPWALRVQRVIGIETIERVYASGTDARALWYVTQTGQIRELIDADSLVKTSACSPSRLWYVTRNGHIQELIDADNLRGAHNSLPTLTITAPQATSGAVQRSERLTTEGLRIYCGAGSYILPLTMATQALESVDLAAISASRFANADRSNRALRIPWIDAAVLLFGKSSVAVKNTVAVTLADGGHILLGVDRVVLSQSLSSAEQWRDVDLPYPVTLFFDAACYDEQSGQWILRAVNAITFAGLPWALKKSVAKAILGWVDRQPRHLETPPKNHSVSPKPEI